MPAIKPISDLRNYNEVLKDCVDGEPVFLTKNGHGKFVIQDIRSYEKQQAVFYILKKIAEAEDAIKTGDEWLTIEDLEKRFGL